VIVVAVLLFVVAVAGVVVWAPWRPSDTDHPPAESGPESPSPTEVAQASDTTNLPPPPARLKRRKTGAARPTPSTADIEDTVATELQVLLAPFARSPRDRAYAAELAPDIADAVSRRVEQDWAIDSATLERLRSALESELQSKLPDPSSPGALADR